MTKFKSLIALLAVLVARATGPNWSQDEEIGDTSLLDWTNEVLTNIIEPIKKLKSDVGNK